MDPAADSGIPTSHTTVGGPGLEQELPLSNAGCQTESGGPLLLQLLEFKTHLFEAVEELHIRRDAETRFEDQISKLVLERQELEWEKESLQHRIKTLENQHTESVTNVKKQFQAKIRNIEEEKGKYQVSAELKEKETNSLKEELRSLQLLKYNLEKKSNELEQKLSLQSRLKDGHLNQLGEVEKRFSILSRQCAMVKQAHEKLEQNVAESMTINHKLTSANEQQEATIVLLKKELEERSSKLIKDKMSSVRQDRADSHTGKEQHVQKLRQKLNMETEMNVKLREENETVRAEKQEVLRSLQCTQQLLLSQTQTVNTLDLELQTQREQHQALKQEHEVMRDKSKAMEDKVAQLMERYAAFKTDWDKEKKTLQDCISCEQRDLRAVRQAYDELQQKHVELSSVAKAQAQHICELEMKSSSQSLGVVTQLSSPNEPVCSSELHGLGLQHSASSQTRNTGCLEDTGGAVTNLDATGATGGTLFSLSGQEDPNHHPQSLNLVTCPLISNNLCSPSGQSATTGSDTSVFKTSETDPGVVSDLMKTTSSVSDNDLKISEGGSVRGTIYTSSYEHKHEGAMSEETNEGGKRQIKEKDDEGQEKSEGNTEQQRNRDEGHREDVEEGGSRGTDRQEENQGSAEDGEPERRDRAERGETGSEPAETQILTQTTEQKGDTQQVIDFMDTEPPLVDCEPSVTLPHKVQERDPDSCHSEESLSVIHRPDVSTDSQNLCHGEAQAHEAEPPSTLPSDIHQAPEKTTEQKPTDESVSDFPVEHSIFCGSQINVEPAQTSSSVSIQESETTTAQTAASDPSDVSSCMNQRDEMSDKLNEGCVDLHLVPESQDTSEQERGRLKNLVTDDDDSCGVYKKSQGQPGDGDSVQGSVEKSNLNKVTVDSESEVESLSFQSRNNSETYLKPSVLQPGPRSSFSWPSVLHQFAQESEQNISGRFRNLLSATPMFSTSQQSKVPLVITRASDLLNASSVSGNAASSTRHQQGEWKALGETCRETSAAAAAAADTVLSERMKLMDVELMDVPPTARQTKNERPVEENLANDAWESRASLSTITSPTVSTSSNTVSDLSWPVTSGCSRAPGSASGAVSESEWELSCSQEREDQQSSFRAQISKIEQFLNTERLHLAKRRRIDN